MSSETFFILFSGIFVLLGVYNISKGLRKTRELQSRGIKAAWYKELNVLLGGEYILLALVFLLGNSSNNHAIPAFLTPYVGILTFILLAGSAVLATLVIRQAIINARRPKAAVVSQAAKNVSAAQSTQYEELSLEQRAEMAQRRRERRQKAAAARRRRAGKA